MIVLTSSEVWDLCHDIYMLYGRKISLPQNTPRENTYQWRYIELLTKKFKEWEFDHHMAEQFLDIVLQYAKDHRLLHKGMALHFQSNLLNICFNRLKAELEMSFSAIYGLRKSQKWIVSTAPSDTIQKLLCQENYGGHTNLVKWYKAGKLTEHYLALSKTAQRAMKQLSPDELEHLPNQASLWLIQNNFLSNPENAKQASEILQGDLRNVKYANTSYKQTALVST